jgi:hypothetical protein
MVSASLLSLRWGSIYKPMRIASEHSLERQEWGDLTRVISEDTDVRVYALNLNVLLTYKFIMNKVIHLSIFEYMAYVILHA